MGAPQLTAASLGNIERGQDKGAKRRRRDVTVEELMVLARALGVPPLLLMVPLDAGKEQVELVPGEAWYVWDAAKWVTGEAYPEGEVATFFAIPLQLNRELQKIRDAYLMLLTDNLFAPSNATQKAERQEEMQRLEYRVLGIRAEMERHGMPMPPWGEEFEHLKAKRHEYLDVGRAERLASQGRLRLPDERGPAKGRSVKPGGPTRLQKGIDQGKRVAEEFEPKEGQE